MMLEMLPGDVGDAVCMLFAFLLRMPYAGEGDFMQHFVYMYFVYS